MSGPKVREAMTQLRECAVVMVENATFIQGELDNVRMSDSLRARTGRVCGALMDTKHEVIRELAEIDGLLGSASQAVVVGSRMYLILQRFQAAISAMHELVMALKTISDQERECGGAYLLVAESTTNVIGAYLRASAAVEAVGTGANEAPTA